MDKQKIQAKQNLTREINVKEGIIIDGDHALVIKDGYPKAQYHFLVVAKENIARVTELTRDHLPLLDHMMELANQIIEQQNHLPPSSFLVGFKNDAFMDRLTMHVISNDFYSVSMRKEKHWNSFNTDIFLTYQAVYARLQIQGSVEPMDEETALNLRNKKTLHCNHCDFENNSILYLKFHLFEHWKKREEDFEAKRQLDKINKMLDKSQIDVAAPGKGEKREEEFEVKRQLDKLTKMLDKSHIDIAAPGKGEKPEANETKTLPTNWRQQENQRSNGMETKEQKRGPYENQFAKQFQPHHEFMPNPRPPFVRYSSLNGNYPPPASIPRPLLNHNNPNSPFMARPAMPHFNPFRQPPILENFVTNRCNVPNTTGRNQSNWKPMNPPKQGASNGHEVRDNFTPMENKPRPQHNQGPNKRYNVRDNSNPMKTQPNELCMYSKHNSKPNPQHDQKKNNNTEVKEDTAPAHTAQSNANNTVKGFKPKWKPKPNQAQKKDNPSNGSPQNKPKWTQASKQSQNKCPTKQ